MFLFNKGWVGGGKWKGFGAVTKQYTERIQIGSTSGTYPFPLCI